MKRLLELLTSSRRRRKAGSAATQAHSALVAALESRQLLAAVQVGQLLYQSEDLGITDPRGFATNGTTTLVVGNDGGVGVMRELTISGGVATVGAEQVLLDEFAAGNGPGAENNSFVTGASVVGGEILPHGYGVSLGLDKPTYWWSAEEPVVVTLELASGFIETISLDGIIAGNLANTAAIGTLSTPFQNILHADTPSDITAITGDSQLASGNNLFWLTAEGSASRIDLSSWEVPAGVLELPDLFFEAVVYNGQHYVAADCTTLGFENVVGVWHAETGELVAVTEVGDQLVDFQEVDGHVALSVNGADGAAVYLNLDFTTRTELSDRLGSTVIAAGGTGLNAGGLGLVMQINGQHRAVVFELLPAATVVESVIHQGNYAPNVISLGTKTFEVGLRGSAALDVTQLDRASLFIGDDRNLTSGKVISVRFTDENKDGFRDAIIKVQTTGTVRADTIRLRITGSTTTGDEFTGSREVTMTALNWSAHWQTTSGTGWRSLFTAYSRGLKKTWW